MSILNIGTTRRYVLVGTDTEAPFDGSRAHLPKMHVLAHLGALIAFRGACQVFTILQQHVNWAQSFEDLMTGMQELIEHSIALAEPSYLATGAPEAHLRHNTVALVGVGSTTGVVVRLWNAYDDPAYRVWDVPQDYSYIAPDFGLGRMSCQTQDEQERVARRQFAHFKRHVESADNPQVGCGGSLILARVDEAGIRIETRGGLDVQPGRGKLFMCAAAGVGGAGTGFF